MTAQGGMQVYQPPAAPALAVETASTVLAAQAKALVSARFELALHRPRNVDAFRQRLLKLCQNPKFAAEAWYRKPVGGAKRDEEDGGKKDGIEGLSIRFIEAALQLFRNVTTDVTAIYDDTEKRILRISVSDMEENVTYTVEVSVKKTVERRFLKKGEEDLVVRQRMNSSGKPVYIRWATDEEILDKVNALTSKAIRTAGSRLLPADVKLEAEEVILATLAKEDAKDPSLQKKIVLDTFFQLGVSAEQVGEALGHKLDNLTPKELTTLRGWAQALKEGHATWDEIMEGAPEVKREPAKQEPKKDEPAQQPPPAAAAPPPAVPDRSSTPSAPAPLKCPDCEYTFKGDGVATAEQHLEAHRARVHAKEEPKVEAPPELKQPPPPASSRGPQSVKDALKKSLPEQPAAAAPAAKPEVTMEELVRHVREHAGTKIADLVRTYGVSWNRAQAAVAQAKGQ